MPEPSPRSTPLANNPVNSLVGEFIEEKRREIADEKARRVKPKRSPFVIPFLAALCLTVWIAPSLMPPREPTLTPDTIEQGARVTLYLASLRIRQYQNVNHRLPNTLTEAGVDTTGITYWKSTNSAFELSTRVQGTRMVYRSSMPDSVFLGTIRLRGIG
jgi:hypothetical protein